MTVHSSPFTVLGSQLASLAFHRATRIQPNISPMSPVGPISYLSPHTRDATVNRELLKVNREPNEPDASS
jgi:hypothetical protein